MDLSKEEEKIIEDFSYITKDKDYLKLKDLPRHGTTTTYDHSVRVAYMSKGLAETFNLDADSAVRASLLHDYCFVNYYEKNDHKGFYLFYHPIEAAQNAKKYQLNQSEYNAIRSHMFPFSMFPTSKIAWIITYADKIVAMKETFNLQKRPEDKEVTAISQLISFIKNRI